MNARPLYLLSAYRPPTSYPVSLADGEAASWMNGYAALWHPCALRGASQPAEAASSYDHDLPKAGAIYCIPDGPQLYQPEDWSSRLKEVGAISFRATADRGETVQNLLTALAENQQECPAVSQECAQLFHAIGLGYLTVETWYDAAEHEHLLDREGFWADVTNALAQTDLHEVRTHLKSAAEKLHAARHTVHSGSFRILDFAVVNPDRLDAPWPGSLAAGLPVNVVSSVSLLKKLKTEQPERFGELMAKCPPGLPSSVEFCVGAATERDDATLAVESQVWNLVHARTDGAALCGQEIGVYGRRTPAAHLHLPSWLSHAGYQSGVISSFDGNGVPHQRSNAVHWPGPDGRSLDVVSKDPLPADQAQTFFNLAYYLHQASTQESQPALVFHHPSSACAGYYDLLALADLSSVLGEWSGVGRYLMEIGPGDYSGPASPDDYAIDSLDDRVTTRNLTDPVSGIVQHHRMRRRLDASFAFAALNRMFAVPDANELADLERLEQLETELETQAVSTELISPLASQLAPVEQSIAERLVARIQSRGELNRPGYVLINPCPFPRRAALELDPFSGPIPVEGPVKAAQFDADKTRLVVEVPSLGFAWIPHSVPGTAPPKAKLKLAEGSIIRNEFFEVEFDPVSGGIKAFRDLRTRSLRMAAIPVYNPGCKTRGTSLTVVHSGTALGEIVSEGQLISELDEPLATFRIRARAWLGRPVLELTVELELTHKPMGYPWHAYYGLRIGTRDDRVALFRGLNGTSYRAGTGHVISPDFFEFRMGRERSFVFPGGIPYMGKHSSRTYDLILVPPGETETKFEMLFSLDRDHPSQTSAGWIAPMPVIATDRGPHPVGTSAWLAHVDMPSLMMTDFRPVAVSGDDMTRAVAMRFLETAGYGGSAAIQFARNPARAFQVNGLGETSHELTIDNDAVPCEFSAGELFRIRSEWGG
ncbi:MAG: hypothetical protein U0798_17185 [Gemmataceae bacterium]